MDLIQTYMMHSNHQHSIQTANIYLEFLEAGILETYSTDLAVNNSSDPSSVFDRAEKIKIINKVGDLLEEYSTSKSTQ